MSDPKDRFDLHRFVWAQAADYPTALDELRRGCKEFHWIWYIFPQVAGLGRSFMSIKYAIRSRAEAEAYLNHELLGPRLRECAAALLQHRGRPIGEIMGYPDDLKLRSSMTLFARVAPSPSVFEEVLAEFHGGTADPATERFLQQQNAAGGRASTQGNFKSR